MCVCFQFSVHVFANVASTFCTSLQSLCISSHRLQLLGCAEATSCRSAVRFARSVVQDVGASAASASVGLNELSRCKVKNSERDVQTVLSKKFCLSLPVELTSVPKSKGVTYGGDFQMIRLRSWMQFIVDFNCQHMLVGLVRPDEVREKAILKEWWKRFEQVEPEHPVFKDAAEGRLSLTETFPLLLHGDEGTGLKKAPFLCISYHSYMGRGTEAANKARVKKRFTDMKLNYSGNAHAHRFMTACLPKMLKDEEAYKDIMRFVANDALDVYNSGVTSCHGQKFWAVIVRVVGDWAWLQKAGCLERSYLNVEKRPRGNNTQLRGICHECMAGTNTCPFEDFSDSPSWKRTQYTTSPFQRRPELLCLPHVESKAPHFFNYDLWHCLHLGTGKVFIATVLCLITETFPDSNIEARFTRLTDEFLNWCSRTRSTPYITCITPLLCGWPDKNTYPNGYWNKGHTTVTLSQFVAHWLSSNDLTGDSVTLRLLRLCKEANEDMNGALTRLYSLDLWLASSTAKSIGIQGRRFLQKFAQAAMVAYEAGQAYFIMMPKMHPIHHIMDELITTAETCQWVLNPLAHAVQCDEDMIGRVCRISRKVSAQH